MIPGEIRIKNTDIEINPNSPETVLEVKTLEIAYSNRLTFPLFEANLALDFERDKAYGKHLDIPAGAAVRFEPGDVKQVQLVEYAGNRRIYGFRGFVNGQSMVPVYIVQLAKTINMQAYSMTKAMIMSIKRWY